MEKQASPEKAGGRKPTTIQLAYTMLTFVLVSYFALGAIAAAIVAAPFLIYIAKIIKQNGRKPKGHSASQGA